MAVSKVWCSKLIHHKIFDTLKKNATKNHSQAGFGNEVKNLINIKDGEIFVWDAYNASVLTTNIRRLHDAPPAAPLKGDPEKQATFQTLRCSVDPAKYNINTILCNHYGSHVAIIGSMGVSILELPVRRGKFGMFEDGKDVIRCRTLPLDERFFQTSNARVLHAEWHPGSASSLHLVLLTSDNAIRIYDCDDPMTCIWKMSLRSPDDDSLFSPSRLGTTIALGDTVVSFDFGQPIPMERHSAVRQSGLDNSTKEETGDAGDGLLWPIYLLLGNGVVYRLLNSLNSVVPTRSQLCGPLRMYPPAEDNYGTDACSLVSLNTKPEVLVVATAEGKLHHCILLGSDDNDQSSNVEDEDAETEGSILCHSLKEPVMYVYETVELELSLTVLALDSDMPTVDNFFCPIRLHKDVLCPERYHCSHGAGVHSVLLPWTQKFRNYFDAENGEEIPLSGTEEHSIVEHVICTKPLPSSPVSPILGLSLVADRLLDPKLVCLTSTLECLVLPLIHSFRSDPIELFSKDISSSTTSSPMQRLYQEPFDQHIQKILRRSVSNPVLRTNFSSELTSQECFQLLSRATQVFREQYIAKQDQAREEIQRRVRLLRDRKEEQMKELHALQEKRRGAEDMARDLTNKFDEASEQQTQLFSRLGHLLSGFESFVPVLSEAEISWKKELTEVNESVELIKSRLKKVKDKAEYHKRIFSGEEDPSDSQSLQDSSLRHSFTRTPPSRCLRAAPSELGSSESQRVKLMLSKEGDAIAKLVNQVKTIDIGLAS